MWKRVKFLGIDFQQDESLCKICDPLYFLFILCNQGFKFYFQMTIVNASVMHDHPPWGSKAWLEKSILQYFGNTVDSLEQTGNE